MSDLLNDLDLAPERETLKEPPKRWRNWWLTTEKSALDQCVVCNVIRKIPPFTAHTNHCGSTWPSKDVAETAARDAICNFGEAYLGAYPEGERP